MSTIRDGLLPVVDSLRGLPGTFGLRRFAVTVRRRVWSGVQPGTGTATNNDVVLTPSPRVRDAFSSAPLSPQEAEYLAANGNVVQGHLYKVDKITPAYTNADGTSGGYSPDQLRLWPNPDERHTEAVVVLVGDDGYARECVQVSFEQDRAFGYSMLLKEQDRARAQLQSVAVTPNGRALASGTSLQLIATGTFSGGTTSRVTPLCIWSSSNTAVATVSLLGVVTAVSSGAATITASFTGIGGSTSVTVT